MSVADDVRVLGEASNRAKEAVAPIRQAQDQISVTRNLIHVTRDKLAWVRGGEAGNSESLMKLERYLITLQEKLGEAIAITELVGQSMPVVSQQIDIVARKLTS